MFNLVVPSQHISYLHKWLVQLNFDMFTATMFTFFSARFLNMWKPRTTSCLVWRACPTELTFCGSGPARLPSWLGMMNVGWFSSIWSDIFLQMKNIIFQGSPTKQPAFLTRQPSPYNRLLVQLVLLVPECYFA